VLVEQLIERDHRPHFGHVQRGPREVGGEFAPSASSAPRAPGAGRSAPRTSPAQRRTSQHGPGARRRRRSSDGLPPLARALLVFLGREDREQPVCSRGQPLRQPAAMRSAGRAAASASIGNASSRYSPSWDDYAAAVRERCSSMRAATRATS
jgi:hypothetical protein